MLWTGHRAGTAPSASRKSHNSSRAHPPPHTSIPLSLTSSGNLSQNPLSLSLSPRPAHRPGHGFPGELTHASCSQHFLTPCATMEPFLTPLSACFLRKAIYNYWVCLSTLSYSTAPDHPLEFHVSAEVDPSQPPVSFQLRN